MATVVDGVNRHSEFSTFIVEPYVWCFLLSGLRALREPFCPASLPALYLLLWLL